ncbi:MAG: hypothetical protein QOG38_1346 [Hyphomicrobiales bacterium]|jgi:hypothetical protein|nr:hypothetical protein [Hyphomicrobiales bacterium]
MLTRRAVIIALAIAAAAGPAVAAESSAQAFLNGIYANYMGKDSKGTSLASTAAINRYFTPSLARLIDADAKRAAKRSEVGALGGDPFIDAQDWELSALSIDVKENGPDKATATVTFKNFGKDVAITHDLVKLKQGWRIDDIHLKSGSLRALFKKA